MTVLEATRSAERPTRKIARPVHFVCPEGKLWPELQGDPQTAVMTGDELNARSGGLLNNWVIRTFYHLRDPGPDVTIGPEMRADAINIGTNDAIGRRTRKLTAFLAIPCADSYVSSLGNFWVRQNFLLPATEREGNIYHWPQPGLIPRSPERGDRIERIAFKGHWQNLDPAFRSETFLAQLRDLGVEMELDFRIGTKGHSWNDFSESDLYLGVRSMTFPDISTKPASKLVNAWTAGVPALLGPEPAFRELRRGELDYFEVETPQDVLDAIARLRATPSLYRDMVRNGLERSTQFSEDVIAGMWVELLNGPVAAAFERWMAMPAPVRALVVLRGFSRHAAISRDFDRRVKTGMREVENAI